MDSLELLMTIKNHYQFGSTENDEKGFTNTHHRPFNSRSTLTPNWRSEEAR